MNRARATSGWSLAFLLLLCIHGYAEAKAGAIDNSGATVNLLTISGDGYSIQEVPGLTETLRWFDPAPSGNTLVFSSPEECLLYSIDDSGLNGPWKHPKGATHQTEMSHETGFPRWVLGPDGKDVYVIDTVEKRGITLENGGVVELNTSECVEHPLIKIHLECPLLPTGQPCPLEMVVDAIGKNQFATFPEEFSLNVQMHTTDGKKKQQTLPLDRLLAVDNTHRIIVLHREERGGHIVLVDLDTGSARTLLAPKGRQADPSYSLVSFSPNGKWILGCFNTGHLSNVPGGGFLHLFSSDGNHVQELAEFSESCGSPASRAYWLNNGWIVYTDRCTGVHLLKFETK